MKLLRALFLFSAVSIFTPAFAQTFQGTLRGRVTDPSGSATPNVKVTATEEATAVNRTTITNQQGEYVFTALTPGSYTVIAELSGFKQLEHKAVELTAQAAVTIDLALEIGQVNESVNVTADAPPLQTADASTGQVINTQQITDLPILGRNAFFEEKLAQSVVFVNNPTMGRMQDQNANSDVSISGGPLRTNNVLVDGISITDSNNRAVFIPSPEALQEVKLQGGTYDAEAGRTGGGTFNSVLRSGTNDLHGSAVGHLRETDWLANTFFGNKAGEPRADQPFKDWAASLGGPIIIPKVYNGRNKTFFFVANEAYREQDGSTVELSVPTALERAGNFSQSVGKSGAQQTIYDPLSTTSSGTRTAFPNNIIPSSEISPIGLQLASYYPLPNAATPYYGAPNYNFTGAYPNRGDQDTFKLDQQLASWLRASASYVYQKTGETDNAVTFPNIASPGQTLLFRRVDATQANATATPNATTVFSFRWGFNRFYSATFPTASAGFNIASLGLPESLAAITPYPAFPTITMGTLTSFGGGDTNSDVYYSRTAVASVSKYLGRHSLKAGFEFRTLHDYGIPASGPTSLGFSDVFTRPNPTAATTGKGADLATMLLGYPTSGSMSVIGKFDDFIQYYGGFVQDDFRVTPKLTLNLGLRFEYESGIQEENNHLITAFNPTAVNPLQAGVNGLPVLGAVEYAGVNGAPKQTGNALNVKPAPRFGVAYSLDNKTVIRAGYGIYWAPTYFSFQNTIGYSQTTSIITSANNNFTPSGSLTNPYPNGLLQPTGNTLGALSGIGQAISVDSPTAQSAGYVQEYSFEVQRTVPAGFVLTVGALGSHSSHLLTNGLNIDQLNPALFGTAAAQLAAHSSVANPFYNNGGVGSIANPTISPIQLLLPYPEYTSVALSNADTAAASYYSFYFRAQRRFANGVSLLASYTFSRSEDDILGASVPGSSNVSSPAGPQNAYNQAAEWSLSTQDVPNRFTTAITYELPFGKGKPVLGNSGRVLNYLVGGWSVNTIGIVQNGFPLSVTQPNNNSPFGASLQRPNATGIAPATSGSTDQRIYDWINPAAFSEVGEFAFGDTSRFLTLRGPGLFNWDASLFKGVVIRERVKAQFRFEAFNATNTVEFANPNTTLTNSSFGLITSQVNHPRFLQLGLRVTF
jgi:trimeric autotransporter adhesin